MLRRYISTQLLAASAGWSANAAPNYPISSSVPSNAAELDATPVGLSFEFYLWPTYMINVSYTRSCTDQVTPLYNGTNMPIRIGGTTQDRAAFDPDTDEYTYGDPETSYFYGPKFLDLISSFGAETTLGLNRGDNNITNTLEAAMAAKASVSEFIWGIELGNEPDLYYSMWNKSVATPPWNESQEGANQAEWSQALIDLWGEPEPILSGGNYAVPIALAPAYPNTDYLIESAFNASVKAGVKVYCTHSYALSGQDALLPGEMNHVKTVVDLSNYTEKIATSQAAGRPYIFGEAGFHALETSQDATFGGALQLLDKTLWSLAMGVRRIYYHQGGLGEGRSSFNWWDYATVELPFYGGYFAALATAGADHIVAGDPGTDAYAQYVVYRGGAPSRVVLVNTEYFSGDGERGATTYTLAGIASASVVRVLRMTAASSEVAAAVDEIPVTIGGQYFSNTDCSILGDQAFEVLEVSNGTVQVSLLASEATIVYLD
ncbi:hypothetical protein F4778DRAFT_750800 [Xylariomycetidae sp. FL2044]|nr:hypothetical protein F4778DRAFT_750800 [Xylariomycetidae sp. FL2044]